MLLKSLCDTLYLMTNPLSGDRLTAKPGDAIASTGAVGSLAPRPNRRQRRARAS